MPKKRRLTRLADKRLRGAQRASGSSAPTEATSTTPSVPPLPAAPAEVIEAAPPTAPAAAQQPAARHATAWGRVGSAAHHLAARHAPDLSCAAAPPLPRAAPSPPPHRPLAVSAALLGRTRPCRPQLLCRQRRRRHGPSRRCRRSHARRPRCRRSSMADTATRGSDPREPASRRATAGRDGGRAATLTALAACVQSSIHLPRRSLAAFVGPAAPTCWAVWTREYASGPSSSCIKCSHKSSQWPQKVVVSLRFSVSPDSPPHRPGVRRRKILVGRWAGAIGRGRVDRAPPWARWTCDRLRSRCAPAWRPRLSG
mmetsp:Transcript_45504/g.150816  ORF Transcript_45504/g.150816 Transcript_45504/m.150816 type:complete len:312 (-) Transcript_45504:61-996(-)